MLKEESFLPTHHFKPLTIMEQKFNGISSYDTQEIRVEKFKGAAIDKSNKENGGWKFDPIAKAWNPRTKTTFSIPKPEPTCNLWSSSTLYSDNESDSLRQLSRRKPQVLAEDRWGSAELEVQVDPVHVQALRKQDEVLRRPAIVGKLLEYDQPYFLHARVRENKQRGSGQDAWR